MTIATVLRDTTYGDLELSTGDVFNLDPLAFAYLAASGHVVATPGATVTKTQYGSTGTGGGGITTLSDGSRGFLDTVTLAEYPLTYVAGTYQEGTINGRERQAILIDSGADGTDHTQVLLTWNCTMAGEPDTPDNDLASLRFANANSNLEVIKTACDGQAAGDAIPVRVQGTTLHIALAGSASYTMAAGNTLTPGTMICVQWNSALGVDAAEIRLGSSTLGTTGYRYRDMIFVGFAD